MMRYMYLGTKKPIKDVDVEKLLSHTCYYNSNILNTQHSSHWFVFDGGWKTGVPGVPGENPLKEGRVKEGRGTGKP